MSQPKMAQTFPARKEVDLDKILMGEIPRILRAAESQPSMRKRLARTSGMSPRTIQKWCDGKNTPSLSSYIHLARCYPGLVDLFLDLCQLRPKKPTASRKGKLTAEAQDSEVVSHLGTPNGAKHVGNNVGNRDGVEACNSRQLWFMLRLHEGATATADALADCWRVSVRTAERDITGLRQRGLITYSGSRRAGHYSLAQPSGPRP